MILDSLLSLSIVEQQGFTYRHGLRYCLRKQTQYEDTFKVNNSREPDSNWKPYLAGILGIGANKASKKYEANKDVQSIENAIKELEALPKESSQSLEAEIAQLEGAVSRMQTELDDFDFRKHDNKINSQLVEDVSLNVTNINKKVYTIDQRLSAIGQSLKTEFSFDLDKVIDLFSEIEVYFPDNLTKSYEELIELNKQMSSGRKRRLKKVKNQLESERIELEKQLEEQTYLQKELASALIEKDTFKKYKILQSRISKEESRLAVLIERLGKLDTASLLSENLDKACVRRSKAEKELELATRVRNNDIIRKAVDIFSEIADEVLGISAFFFAKTNKDGNLQFEIKLRDQTSLQEGFSYNRTLSAIFDITLLLLYSNQEFYRFCYHDGLFESLDDRLKIKLIKSMRGIAKNNGLQLIVSVLDSDIPIGLDGNKQYFESKEIIRELHDQGNNGRLFRMEAF